MTREKEIKPIVARMDDEEGTSRASQKSDEKYATTHRRKTNTVESR